MGIVISFPRDVSCIHQKVVEHGAITGVPPWQLPGNSQLRPAATRRKISGKSQHFKGPQPENTGFYGEKMTLTRQFVEIPAEIGLDKWGDIGHVATTSLTED
jgi:hypothetical protein